MIPDSLCTVNLKAGCPQLSMNRAVLEPEQESVLRLYQNWFKTQLILSPNSGATPEPGTASDVAVGLELIIPCHTFN